MVALADRLKNVHPNAQKKVRPGAKYVSHGLQEYEIKQDNRGLFFISKYKGGKLAPALVGTFTTFYECERRLIAYLKSKDKWGKAVYPDG